MLIMSSVPSKFWVEALTTTTFLINRLPSPVLDFEFPYFKPYTNLHIFRCVFFMHLPPQERNMSTQSIHCALGYNVTQKVIYIQTLIGFMSRNVLFFENQWFFFPMSSSSKSFVVVFFLSSFDDTFSSTHIKRSKLGMVYHRRPTVFSLSDYVLPTATLHHSFRIFGPSNRYGFLSCMTSTITSALSATLSFIAIPIGYSQAIKEKCWQEVVMAISPKPDG